MTDKMFSLIDTMLQSVEPDYSSIGLKKPMGMKEQFAANEASQVDAAFLNELGGASEHTIVSGGKAAAGARETRPIKDATTGDSALADAFKTLGAVENHRELDALTTAEVEGRIDFLLNLGHKPNRVASYVQKVAGAQRDALVVPAAQSDTSEAKAITEGMGNTYEEPNKFLNKVNSSLLGSAYIQPDFYRSSCVASFEKIKKDGHLHALSVKKIAACNGCTHNCGSCSLYGRPIVASAKELETVIKTALDQKGIKVTSTLKAAMLQLRDGGEKKAQALPYSRNTEKYTVRTAGDKVSAVHKEASVEEVSKMVASGVPLGDIYKNAAAQYGKVSTMSAIKRFIAGLKQNKSKIVLAALDCSYLKGKLAASNTIVGESKCASCGYRGGMHCGLTGGTLLTFPGMDKVRSQHIAHEGSKDGQQVLFEFDLLDKAEDSPIDFREPKPQDSVDVELNRTSSIDIED